MMEEVDKVTNLVFVEFIMGTTEGIKPSRGGRVFMQRRMSFDFTSFTFRAELLEVF